MQICTMTAPSGMIQRFVAVCGDVSMCGAAIFTSVAVGRPILAAAAFPGGVLNVLVEFRRRFFDWDGVRWQPSLLCSTTLPNIVIAFQSGPPPAQLNVALRKWIHSVMRLSAREWASF